MSLLNVGLWLGWSNEGSLMADNENLLMLKVNLELTEKKWFLCISIWSTDTIYVEATSEKGLFHVYTAGWTVVSLSLLLLYISPGLHASYHMLGLWLPLCLLGCLLPSLIRSVTYIVSKSVQVISRTAHHMLSTRCIRSPYSDNDDKGMTIKWQCDDQIINSCNHFMMTCVYDMFIHWHSLHALLQSKEFPVCYLHLKMLLWWKEIVDLLAYCYLVIIVKAHGPLFIHTIKLATKQTDMHTQDTWSSGGCQACKEIRLQLVMFR